MPTTSAARKSARIHRSAPTTPVFDNVVQRPSDFSQANTVQDRIRQWQAQATTTGLASPDVGSVSSAPQSDICITPDISRPGSPEAEEDEVAHVYPNTSPRGRSNGRYVDMAQREWIRKGRATTPRRRLVSDEHWKSKRDDKQTAPVEIKDKRPIEKIFLETILPNKDVDRTISKARAEREERRRRRRDARARKVDKVTNDEEVNTGRRTERYSSRRSIASAHRSPSEKHERSPELYFESPPSHRPLSSPTYQQEPPQETFYDRDGVVNFENQEHERRPSRSKYAETLGHPPEYAQQPSEKSRKGSILSKTKGIFGKQESTRVASNPVPTIEAWLDDQLDPFVEEVAPVMVSERSPETERPKPLKSRSAHQKISIGSPLADSNKIWDSVGASQIESHHHSRVKRSGAGDVEEVEPAASPVTLQRRGARSSRPSGRTTSEAPLPDIIENHDPQHGQPLADMSLQQSSERLYPPPTTSKSSDDRVKNPERVVPLDDDPPPVEPISLKRKLTTHEHLMSELSRPRSSKSIRRARSVKITNRKAGEDMVQKILQSMKDDEIKYSRELRTLVDGVIPVLLQCVLTKSDAVAAAALFTSSTNAEDDMKFSKPIIDMGVALQRLKTLHNRIPLANVDSLLSWCQTAHKAYVDYVKAWRLGFQDIIVNLAPLEGGQEENTDIMERDKNGDVVGTDGEKVDVAFLLKRPLVRIRKLGKDLCCLSAELNQLPIAARIADDYVDLTSEAKRKHSQEQGRLEDEAAANVDATRVRNISTMAPKDGVRIDKSRRVRARDCFDMTLHHSSGQRMDCRVELILRDNQPDQPPGGDVLICGIENDGRFLLFAPVDLSAISARKNGSNVDLVVMIRGRRDLRSEWHELLALKAELPEAAAEWFNMLGSNPVPPGLNRVPTFLEIKSSKDIIPPTESIAQVEGLLPRIPSIKESDVPIGEPSVIGAAPAVHKSTTQKETIMRTAKPLPKLSLGGGLQQKPVPEYQHMQQQHPTLPLRSSVSSKQSSIRSPDASTISGYSFTSGPSSLAEHRTTAKHSSSQRNFQHAGPGYPIPPGAVRYPPQVAVTRSAPTTPRSERNDRDIGQVTPVQLPQSSAPKVHQDIEPLIPRKSVTTRPEHRRASSSIPLREPPSLGKTGAPAATDSPSTTPLTNSIRDTWVSLAGKVKRTSAGPTESPKQQRPVSVPVFTDHNSFLRHGIGSNDEPRSVESANDGRPPPPPNHMEKTTLSSRSNNIPSASPIDLPVAKVSKPNGQLSSSPLKHEYAPSTASDTAEEFESDYSDDESVSETSEDLESELKDEAKSLPDVSFPRKNVYNPPVRNQQKSVPTTGTHTIAPSDSASQGPYRRAPPASVWPADKKKRAMALVCSWSDSGMWQPIRDEDCSIVVSPGLIEVFPGSSIQTTNSQLEDERPLVAFELTPIVQLRQGTAVDITIRSQPTANSQIKNTNNTMFRSRTVVDSNALYNMIHWSRCNNPTYIELERSRPRPQPVVTFSNQQPERPKSWFSFGGPQRRNSYRAGSMPPPSIQNSVASAGSVSNAISALKKFSKGSAFSISRSSVVRRPGRGTNQSLYSSSAETNTASGSGSSTPAPPTQLGHIPGKDGPNVPETSAAAVQGAGMINNMKIEFFFRHGNDWRPMGSGRLSILPAPVTPHEEKAAESSNTITPPGTATPSGRGTAIKIGQPIQRREYRLPSSSNTPHRLHGDGREKRVVITKNKRPDIVFLDVILGESCFEKIAERGIAMNVWKEHQQIRHTGGVMIGRSTMYMMKFESSSEASWVFGLCGTYRYRYQEIQ